MGNLLTAERVAHRFLEDRQALIARAVTGRYLVAMLTPKKRYELYKSVLGKPKVNMHGWLLVVKALGWKHVMVKDPDADRQRFTWDVKAPNGKSMLVFPHFPSPEEEDEFDAWMRHETNALERMQQLVQEHEARLEKKEKGTARPMAPADFGVPIDRVDFSGHGHGSTNRDGRFKQTVNFGLSDDRNRVIGCSIEVFQVEETHTWLTSGSAGRKPATPGDWIAFVVPHRNGKRFGSSEAVGMAPTRTGALAFARKAMMASFKRYSKLYPLDGGPLR